MFITSGMVRVWWRNMGNFPRGEGFKMRHLAPDTTLKVWLLAMLLAAIVLWIVCILLMVRITVLLLDTLALIVELAALY